jgi:hypothetical protein
VDERLEQLCRRLSDDSGPLTTPGPLHDLAARIAGRVRAGHPDISAQLDDLEDQLLCAGYAAGLSGSRTPYAAVPGLGHGHPVLSVLACPAERCTRVEPPPPGDAPICAVMRRPLRRVQLG